MCLAEGSLEYSTSTCKMCAVMKEVYRKPHSVCPHKNKMQVCRRRENHPRGADIVHHTNAEIRTFNGCGYCKWAESHPELTKRELLHNQGWPGCCRAPLQNEYQQYIRPEDWAAVSHLYKYSRSSSNTEDAPKLAPSSKDDISSSKRSSWRVKSATTGSSTVSPSAVSGLSGRSIGSRGVTDPIVRSSSPLRRASTPPPTGPSGTPSQRSQKVISSSKASPSPSDDSPDTPPARSLRELSGSSTPTSKRSDPSRSSGTRDVTVVRYAPSEVDIPLSSVPRRQMIAIQSQSSFYRNSKVIDDFESAIPVPAPSSKVRLNPSPPGSASPLRASPNSQPVALDSSRNPPSAASNSFSPRGQNSHPPTIEVVPTSTRELPEERTPRFSAAIPNNGAAKYTSSPFMIASPTSLNNQAGTERSWPPPSPTSSSSSSSSSARSTHSSDSGGASETSTSSRGSARSEVSDDASTTRGGGSSSSDFTDFLSDDSEYEIEREAEERAATQRRMRVERAEDREFRDAQQRLELFDLTESMDLRPLPPTGAAAEQTTRVGVNGTIGRRGTVMSGSRPPESFQGVFVGRY